MFRTFIMLTLWLMLMCLTSVGQSSLSEPKDNDGKPITVLRNVADIKSPIAVYVWNELRCGATGLIIQDSADRYFLFYRHGEYAKGGWKPENVSVGAFETNDKEPATGFNFKRNLDIAGEEEKALLRILQDWKKTVVPEKTRLRLSQIIEIKDEDAQYKEASSLSKEEHDLYVIFSVIKDLESR
jgi:hypothetical protein